MKKISTYAGITARQALEECRIRRKYGYPRPKYFDHPGFSNAESAADAWNRHVLYVHPAGNWPDDYDQRIKQCPRCGVNFIGNITRFWCKQCVQGMHV